MIQKVNAPVMLSLVGSTKQTQNDPGSSQGGGMAYDGPPQKSPDSEPEASAKSTAPEEPAPEQTDENAKNKKPHLALVVNNQAGMSDVVRELLEAKEDAASGSRAGLAMRYSGDGTTAKGLLLNKKVE